MSSSQLSLGLFTDLYELTMAQAYWQNEQTAPATFSLFFRKYPHNRAYFVLAGLEDALEYLEGLHFSPEDIAFLRGTGKFDEEFLEFLGHLRFSGSVRAMPEGTLFFTNEPVMEVTAPIIEAQLAETFLVNQVNLQSMLATKGARVVHAARGRMVVDFAARRTHGIDAANKLARATYMVGFAGTSNVLAGGLYGIPTFGTMAHSFVTSFESEAESFRAYARSFPDSTTLLVDTYDSLEGTRKAIAIAREMQRQGHTLRAIRLDSGDLLDLSIKARALLDEAGLHEVQVFASGGLDEYEVDALLRAGAPIDGFGVGTKVGVSADAPWTDCAYKLVEYAGKPTLKLSTDKQTLPGPKQVYRYHDEAGLYSHDVICRADEPPPQEGGQPLLHEVMRAGRRLQPQADLQALRERFQREFARLPEQHKALESPAPYSVAISQGLEALSRRVVQEVTERELSPAGRASGS